MAHRFLVTQQLPTVPRCGLAARAFRRWVEGAKESAEYWVATAAAVVKQRRTRYVLGNRQSCDKCPFLSLSDFLRLG